MGMMWAGGAMEVLWTRVKEMMQGMNDIFARTFSLPTFVKNDTVLIYLNVLKDVVCAIIFDFASFNVGAAHSVF